MPSKILFLIGPGGVGKTTISAAAGFALKDFGKTIVMTIDPAKRLKSALSIPIDGINKIDENLFVTQVDKENEFRRFAFENNIEDITRTKLFEIAADLLPSEEYSAFIKIVDIYENNDFDFIVVDTPPSLKFLSFLDAPEKVLSMFETSSVRYFLEIVATAGKRMSIPISIAGKLLGADFVVDFAKFLSSLKTIFHKMQDISHKSLGIILKSKILGVASPYDRKIEELIFLIKEINRRKVSFSGIVVNRFINFTIDGIPSNSPEGVLNFHRKLVMLSDIMKKNIDELAKFRKPMLVLEEKFADVNSIDFVKSISGELKGFLTNLLEI